MRDRTFQWPLYFDVRDYFKGAFGVYRGKAEEIALVFEKEAARWVKGRKWHESQSIQALKGDRLRMTLRTAVTPELLQWVLGFGPQVYVEQPVILARMVRNAAWKLLGRYEGVVEKRGKSVGGSEVPGDGKQATRRLKWRRRGVTNPAPVAAGRNIKSAVSIRFGPLLKRGAPSRAPLRRKTVPRPSKS